MVTSSERGFTVIELMILVVVAGMLASIALPIGSNRVELAKRTEADASLAFIRTHLNAYRVQNESYPISESPSPVMEAVWNDLVPGELSGRYLSDGAFSYKSDAQGMQYQIMCAGMSVFDSNRMLDHTGTYSDF